MMHSREVFVDGARFDTIARTIGEQTTRRMMVRTAAGSALALLGLGVIAGDAVGQDVTAEARGFKGRPCDTNRECRKGLRCGSNGKCEYKRKCGGKKNDACNGNNHCCGGFECRRKKCKRKR